MRLPAGTFFGVRARECATASALVALRDADPARTIARHEHEDAHLVLVLAGDYETTAEGRCAAGARPLILNPPGTVHADRFARGARGIEGRFLTVSFAPGAWPSLVSSRRVPPHARQVVAPRAHAAAHELARLVAVAAPGDQPLVEELALQLVGATLAAPMPAARGAPWLARAIAQLLDRGAPEPDITTLAAEAGVHPVYFVRAFRRQVGVTPMALRRRVRVAEAVARLRGGALPSVVAQATGFADQSHLARAVRQATGQTPGALRRGA